MEHFGRYLQGAEVDGDVTLDLDLTLPLAHGAHTQVKGDLTLKGNTVRFRDLDLELGAATGELTFTERGLTGKGIEVRLLDQPARLSVRTEAGRPGGGLSIQASGRMPLARLAQRYPTPVDGYLAGTAAYGAEVAVVARNNFV